MRNIILLCTILSLSGCVENSNAESPLPETEAQQLKQGFYTNSGTYTKKQLKIITSQADYNEELANYTSDVPAEIDFDKGRVLLMDMGQRNTGGYSIGLDSIDVFEAHITANVNLSKPGQNCVVTQALTNPYQFVYIPTEREVLVSESLTIYTCEE